MYAHLSLITWRRIGKLKKGKAAINLITNGALKLKEATAKLKKKKNKLIINTYIKKQARKWSCYREHS